MKYQSSGTFTVHKKKIFEVIFLNTCKSMLNFDPCPGHDPIYDPRVMIWTNLNPHVLRMLHMKYPSSGTYSSQEEDFW